MSRKTFTLARNLPVPAEAAYSWHARPGALGRLTPPWESVKTLSDDGEIADGNEVQLAVKKNGLTLKWLARYESVDAPHSFSDRQVNGPFKHWLHRHSFEGRDSSSSQLRDAIEYELPLGGLGSAVMGSSVRSDLDQMFRYRHDVTELDLARHGKWAGEDRLKVAMSGTSGLLGRNLAAFLTTGGHEVVDISRRVKTSDAETIRWDTEEQVMDARGFERCDVAVHLAGESIASGRWNEARKQRIARSRIDGTRALVDALEKASPRPKVLICASAVGIYGDRGDEVLSEDSEPGTGFLAELASEWEAQAKRAEDLGVRVVMLRLGVILTPEGGALQKMLPAFRAGVAGRLGNGKQWMSWISIEDVIGIVHEAMWKPEYRGAINMVSPEMVTNAGFTSALGRVLRRPTLIPIPAFALKTLFGEMADAALLASTRAKPRRLAELGYEFYDSNLEHAMRRLMGRLKVDRGES